MDIMKMEKDTISYTDDYICFTKSVESYSRGVNVIAPLGISFAGLFILVFVVLIRFLIFRTDQYPDNPLYGMINYFIDGIGLIAILILLLGFYLVIASFLDNYLHIDLLLRPFSDEFTEGIRRPRPEDLEHIDLEHNTKKCYIYTNGTFKSFEGVLYQNISEVILYRNSDLQFDDTIRNSVGVDIFYYNLEGDDLDFFIAKLREIFGDKFQRIKSFKTSS